MPRIVIVGAGIGGWGVARALERAAALSDVEVVVIDKRPNHEFTPLLYEVATGLEDGRREECERILASGVCVNLATYERVVPRMHVQFLWDEVIAIDRRTRHVRTRANGDVAFDALVLALGAETAYYGITGLREHAIPLKTVRDALRIRRRVLDLVTRSARGSGARARIVVGGGGATGVEFVAELANALGALVARGDLRREDYEIALIEGGSRLLGAFPAKLSREALRRLHRYGVRVYLDALVSSVELGSVTVAPRPLRGGEERAQLLCGFDGASCAIEADCIVWTGGVAYPSLPNEAGFSVDERGRVLVDASFLVAGERCVFALGDCAAFIPRGATTPLAPLASVAVRQAPVAAANALSCIERGTLRSFHVRPLPAIVPLGGRYAGFVYRSFVWIGWLPWALHSCIALAYFVGAFGTVHGFRTWVRGANVYVQND